MLHRRIYQLSREGKDVWIYLRDQGRWLERAKILDIEGDTILVRYETEDEEEICSWEEMVRLESIGAVAQRLSTIPKGILSTSDLLISEECPAAELLNLPLPESEDHPHEERLLEDYYLDREAPAELPVRLNGEDLKRADCARHDSEGQRESNHD
ncbi:MAG: hypothetical protein Q6L68_02740 [Thermostichus sp. DG02_5_bins_236]